MEQVKVTDLRSHLPDYLERVQKGASLQITSHGKVIARLVPESDSVEQAGERLKALRGTMITGEIISHLEDIGWSADADNL